MSLLKPSEKIGNTFQNPIPTRQLTEDFFTILRRQFTAQKGRTPGAELGPFNTDPKTYNVKPPEGLRVTWFGHSSILIEVDGVKILTDPVWHRASPVQFAGPKRFFKAPLPLSELPPLDIILISHDHYDHLDKLAVAQLKDRNCTWICPLGVKSILSDFGVQPEKIFELDWMQSTITANQVKITALPARHFSGRGVFNRNQTLWASFAIKGPEHSVYYGADSGPFLEGYKEIGQAFGPFHLALLEIGAYGDGWGNIHMGPENAVLAAKALNAEVLMPIHWGTFNLAQHPWKEPVERALKAAEAESVSLLLPEPGVPCYADAGICRWWERAK